ncbi:multidrug effflux MFS transporter [Pyruvatibacter mobilis]|uniref:Bcr/CflA family efflux transporter n=1 Tax=Pyruvatibacter mobilis TaxID=1712261 RepID=A0A845QEI3_9HYPH|nr:multidrug effflux MFS transporter [Pyruvatibacter mobilis]NBG96993.1 Bcr/CflA family efflux MFS transporter [Pyruvatibacter mobilis]QJD74452.1 multidrug effflux MFS transporter [Pyruvatibacter mobilis]GGD07065.1 Bcr/CflA family drug resistance efflux transporter [Pyruvatibacter mobilis]
MTTSPPPSSPSPALSMPRWELVGMVAALMALNALAIDVFIPALTEIGEALAVEEANRRQFVISAYVMGFGAAQLFYGTISDRFGRRPVLMFGLAVYVAASALAAYAPNFESLLAIRFIQGVGTAATRVIAVSVVRDTFGGARMASVMSLVMMVFMAVPLIAPNVGQVIILFGNWQSVFWVTGILGAVMAVWSYLRLPETLHPEYRLPLTFSRVSAAFRVVVTTRASFGYSLATALTFAVLFAFINQAEQLFTQTFGMGEMFTLAFSAIALFMALSSFMNSRLVERLGMRRLSHLALSLFLALIMTGLVLAFTLGDSFPVWLFGILMAMLFACFGFTGTNFNALAMDPLGHVAGTASSVLGFMQTFVGGVLGALIGYLYDGTVVPLFIGYLLLALGAVACVAVAEGGRLFGPDDDLSIVPAAVQDAD